MAVNEPTLTLTTHLTDYDNARIYTLLRGEGDQELRIVAAVEEVKTGKVYFTYRDYLARKELTPGNSS